MSSVRWEHNGAEARGLDTEILVYRVVGLAFLVCLPVALCFIILPARELRKRILWSAVAFVGVGSFFIGLVASWPGPNTITSLMMMGGLFASRAPPSASRGRFVVGVGE
jgi:hypothetical protein